MLDTTQAAAILGVSPRRVRALISAGRLRATRQETARGPVLMIRATDLDKVKDRKPGRPPASD